MNQNTDDIVARITAIADEVGEPRPAGHEGVTSEAVTAAASGSVTDVPEVPASPAGLEDQLAAALELLRAQGLSVPTVESVMAMNEDVPGPADAEDEEDYVTWEGGVEDEIRGADSGLSAATYLASEAERAEREEEARLAEIVRRREESREMFGKIQGILEHIKFPSEMAAAYRGTLGLWLVHTWTHAYQDSTPYVLLTSPAAESGKTTALEVLASMAHAAVIETGMTAPNLISYANDGQTVMIDEADELTKNKDFKGAINSGYKQSGFVTRKVGRERVRFSTFAPKVIAGIAREKMPVEGATLTRCISIKLMRALPSEVTKFRPRHPQTKADLDAIKTWVKTWAEANGPALGDAYPEVPASIGNRAAELWEPLLAVAEALGDDIAAQARKWAVELQGQAEKAVDPNVAFLADLRTALLDWMPNREIGKDHKRTSRIKVADLHERWLALEERAFTEKLDLNRFSRRIAAFGIKSTPDRGARWYRVVDVDGDFTPEWGDTFDRYAPEADEAGEDDAE